MDRRIRIFFIILLLGMVSLASPVFAQGDAFTQTLKRGSSGEEVRRLQAYLKEFPVLYPEGTITGYFGDHTKAAVERFQQQNGLSAIGIVGPQTRQILNARLVSEPTLPVADASHAESAADAPAAPEYPATESRFADVEKRLNGI